MMKWWGWGSADFEFPMAQKPELWPWISKVLEISEPRLTPPVPRSAVKIVPPKRHEAFSGALTAYLRPDQISDDEDQRLLHSYGKSYPDLFFVRRGIVTRAPDLVLFPENHHQVERIMRDAVVYDIALVPFGGGTNIVGGVNPKENGKLVATVSLARMNRLLSLDPYSNIAVIEAGALGPKLEADLLEKGYSLGHFPDSFEFSTVGGWVATRSAGMQSDAFGKIEDMVVSLTMVTPSGTIETRPVPACSSGPDLNRLMAGSEGVLGIITECTMRVHRAPAAKDHRGFLFRDFASGVSAMHDCLEDGVRPNIIRLQDPFETQLAFHMKTPKTGLVGFVQKQVKKLLKARGYGEPVIMIMGVEGAPRDVAARGKAVRKILKKRGGFDLGKSVGATWYKDKYNLPYLRDWVMDRACMVDVAETSTLWSNVLNLHEKVTSAMTAKFKADGTPGFIGCHLSHTYKPGACMYFTYACKQLPGRELEQYYACKKLITQTFLDNGATLTHHHAVGTEHRPWLEQELSPTGVKALRALKAGLDPAGLCNPGKLIPDLEPFLGWAQSTKAGDDPGQRRNGSARDAARHEDKKLV